MIQNQKVKSYNQFYSDIIEGLSQPLKKIRSKYFYDESGSKLFQQIMNLEEYYLPGCELEILQNQTSSISDAFGYDTFHLVELGAGDGTKTVHFISELQKLNKNITYFPLDISGDALLNNKVNILQVLPNIEIHPITGDYFKTLDSIKSENPKLLMFMGSNLGNYENEEAINFLKFIYDKMNFNDALMIGVDLRKNPKTIINAYDDKLGITRQFNLNLLKRINNELDADFDISSFEHYPYYDPISGIAYSYLFSTQKQLVTISGTEIPFEKNELILTEVSQKYSLSQLYSLRKEAGFKKVVHFLDSKEYYSISVFKK